MHNYAAGDISLHMFGSGNKAVVGQTDLLHLQDANISDIKVQVCLYAFDLLFLNGKVSWSTAYWGTVLF